MTRVLAEPTFKSSQLIDRPIDEVFAVAADVAAQPAWSPTVLRATKLTEGPIGLGTRFRMAVKGQGQFEVEIAEYDPPRRLRVSNSTRQMDMYHQFVLTSEGERTRVEHLAEVCPKGLFRLLSPILGMVLNRNMRAATEGFQRHLERRG